MNEKICSLKIDIILLNIYIIQLEEEKQLHKLVIIIKCGEGGAGEGRKYTLHPRGLRLRTSDGHGPSSRYFI